MAMKEFVFAKEIPAKDWFATTDKVIIKGELPILSYPGKAVLVQNDIPARGTARLYQLDPPYPYQSGDATHHFEHVVVLVHMAVYPGMTVVFAANADGSRNNQVEKELMLFWFYISHEDALEKLGYAVID